MAILPEIATPDRKVRFDDDDDDEQRKGNLFFFFTQWRVFIFVILGAFQSKSNVDSSDIVYFLGHVSSTSLWYHVLRLCRSSLLDESDSCF
jgi:hypothetical protein